MSLHYKPHAKGYSSYAQYSSEHDKQVPILQGYTSMGAIKLTHKYMSESGECHEKEQGKVIRYSVIEARKNL